LRTPRADRAGSASRLELAALVTLPPYRAGLGDPKSGEALFHSYCSRCHGVDGTGGPKGGSVVNPAYFALVGDQSLRTTIIAGRAGQPTGDWKSYSPGQPMTPQEISDVVAWLSAQRALPGDLPKGGTSLK
jgi:cytochrome c oxidase cbb3-type subunit 3